MSDDHDRHYSAQVVNQIQHAVTAIRILLDTPPLMPQLLELLKTIKPKDVVKVRREAES